MPNPYNYSEQFMHSQRDPRWAGRDLGSSGLRMWGYGCVVTSAAYILSRFLGRDVTPGELLDFANANGGFDQLGQFDWGIIAKFTGGRLTFLGRSLWLWQRAQYTMPVVKLGLRDHFMVLLRNPANGKTDICFDPNEDDGSWVQSFHRYHDTGGRRYFKANTPPKT